MQDAVVELHAVHKYGSRESSPVRDPARGRLGTPRRAHQEAAGRPRHGHHRQGRARAATRSGSPSSCGTAAAASPPTDVPRTIFQVGAGHKDGVDWQQGTYGLGGATHLPQRRTVVLVTRRHPDLLGAGEEDRITIAVVQREREHTTANAFYLVTRPWDRGDPSTWAKAVPFSVPAADYPDFEPGTHVALIAYDTEGLGRRSGDEKSFDTILNTRLFRPVLPIKYRNNITRSDRDETLDGLARRLDDNPGEPGTEGDDTLPFNHNGTTYQLPIRFRLFAKSGEKGERRNFVAHGHALLITSNGQVHSHWTPQDFKLHTKLNKLYDRVLVVVESDALPIEIRTELFTADRAQLVRSAVAMRLEKEVAAFLDEWPALRDANNALIREAITGDNNDRPTIAIAEQIARAFKAKGFSLGGAGTGTGGGGRGPKPPTRLRPRTFTTTPPTSRDPSRSRRQLGKVKGVYFKLNATDGFISKRGPAPGHLRPPRHRGGGDHRR